MFKMVFPLLLFLLNLNCKAQWLALPTPTYYCNYTYAISASIIIPIADKRIVYTTFCPGTHGGVTNIYLSTDDLTTGQLKYSNAPYTYGNSYLSNLYVYNDSTFSYCIWENTYEQQYYTHDNFSTRVGIGGICGNATAISQNYVFGIMSSMFYRANKLGQQSTYSIIPNYTAKYDKLNFINDSVGFTLAHFNSNTSKSALIKITNYGFTWSPALVDSVDAIVDYHISKHGDLYLLKKSGGVYKSADSGASFTPLSSVPLGTYTCIHFANNTTGFIGGPNGVLFKTQDGGINWTSETSNTTQQINAIYTFNNDVSYFVDAKKRVYKSTQALGVSEESEGGSDLFVFPNPAIHELTIQYNSITGNEVKIEVVDISGRIVINSEFVNKCKLDVSNLSDGIYSVRLVENNRVVKTRKVIISR